MDPLQEEAEMRSLDRDTRDTPSMSRMTPATGVSLTSLVGGHPPCTPTRSTIQPTILSYYQCREGGGRVVTDELPKTPQLYGQPDPGTDNNETPCETPYAETIMKNDDDQSTRSMTDTDTMDGYTNKRHSGPW